MKAKGWPVATSNCCGAAAEGVAAAARPLPLLVQLAGQRPLGGRGPEPGSPDQVANEEQPDQSHGQQDFPGSTGSVSHDPIHSSRYRRRVQVVAKRN